MLCSQDISGTYALLGGAPGRSGNQPVRRQAAVQVLDPAATMGENSQSSVEEVVSIEDLEADLAPRRPPPDKATLHLHQKDADENLFLR